MRRSWAVPSPMFFALLAVLTVLTILTPSSASAASRAAASGSFTQLSFTVTGSRTAGGLTFLSFTETDALSGSLTGTSELAGECIVFPSLEAMCKATETFTGTFDGSSGTLTFNDVVRLNTSTGAVSGLFVITDRSGGLANVSGTGAFSGSGGTGTYSGTFTVG